MTHIAAQRTVLCTAKPGRVAADAPAEISAETAVLIAGSNKDLVLLAECTHASTLDCMQCRVILTLPSFCSCP